MRNVVRSSDIVVVGAGVVGAAVAYELTRRGASVSIVDARAPGAGATQASGGMLAPYTEAAEGGPLLTLGARSRGLFRSLVEDVHADSGIEVNYRECGSLHVAHADATLEHFDLTCTTLAALGVPATRLSAADVRAHEPHLAGDVRGGLLLPSQAVVSAPELTRALIAAAQRRGATLLEPSRVLSICSRSNGIVVDTDRGRIGAEAVVLAAGAWSTSIKVEGADQGDGLRALGGTPQVAAGKGRGIGGGLERGALVSGQGGDQVLADTFGMKHQGGQQKGQGGKKAHGCPLGGVPGQGCMLWVKGQAELERFRRRQRGLKGSAPERLAEAQAGNHKDHAKPLQRA